MNPIVFHYLMNDLKYSKTILDLGCGPNSGVILSKLRAQMVGVDACPRYIQELRSKTNGNVRLLVADMRHVWFSPNSFDDVVMIDALEHITKHEGITVIQRAQAWAKHKVIVYTPNGFIENHRDNNPLQEHRSGWTVRDLMRLGFRVYGQGGAKALRTEGARVKWKPTPLWEAISWTTEPIVRVHPSWAFALYAVWYKT